MTISTMVEFHGYLMSLQESDGRYRIIDEAWQ